LHCRPVFASHRPGWSRNPIWAHGSARRGAVGAGLAGGEAGRRRWGGGGWLLRRLCWDGCQSEGALVGWFS
jgi:hypothetical protein